MAFCQGFEVHSCCIVCLQQPNVTSSIKFATCGDAGALRFWKTFNSESLFFFVRVRCVTIAEFNEVAFTGNRCLIRKKETISNIQERCRDSHNRKSLWPRCNAFVLASLWAVWAALSVKYYFWYELWKQTALCWTLSITTCGFMWLLNNTAGTLDIRSSILCSDYDNRPGLSCPVHGLLNNSFRGWYVCQSKTDRVSFALTIRALLSPCQLGRVTERHWIMYTRGQWVSG